MDKVDGAIVNALQGAFPVCARPFAEVGAGLSLSEGDLISRVRQLIEAGVLTRFGPLFQIERLGGAYALAAMRVPADDFDRVAAAVNALPEVAHNYERDHEFNMWFVLATEDREGIHDAMNRIERETRLRVYLMPKCEEFYVGLNLTVEA
jgi:DNA-binding Lrp family transcriptional regulator